MKELYVNKNKYIRLRIAKVGCTYRADISINKYAYDKNEERYYEINFDVFSPYDYSSEEETFEKIEELTCGTYDFETQTINLLIKNQKRLIDEINKIKEK